MFLSRLMILIRGLFKKNPMLHVHFKFVFNLVLTIFHMFLYMIFYVFVGMYSLCRNVLVLFLIHFQLIKLQLFILAMFHCPFCNVQSPLLYLRLIGIAVKTFITLFACLKHYQLLQVQLCMPHGLCVQELSSSVPAHIYIYITEA